MKYVVVVAIFMAFAILVFAFIGQKTPVNVSESEETMFTCPPERAATPMPSDSAGADPEY